MATLTGKTIAATYTSLLKLEGDSGSTQAGASGNAVQVKTGDDDATPVYLNTDRVGIGQATPLATLEVEQGSSGGVIALLVDNNDTDKVAVSIEAANIDADVMDISADAVTTAKVIDITADALTTGSALYIDSDSSSTGTRNIVNIIQNNASASGAVALRIQQDSAADIVNIFDGATEVFTILNGGNVGIGIVSPNYPLEVAKGGDKAQVAISCFSADNTDYAELQLKKSGTDTVDASAATASGEDIGRIGFYGMNSGSPGFVESARIEVIGKPSPDDNSQPGEMSFWTMDNVSLKQRMVLTGSGLLGIGTGFTAPGHHLTISTTDGTSAMSLVREDTGITAGETLGAIYFGGDDPTDGTYQLGASILAEADAEWGTVNGSADGSDCPSNLVFYTAPDGSASLARRMTIKSTGNVGIGETAPANLLYVKEIRDDTWTAKFESTSTGDTSSAPYGISILWSGGAPDNAAADPLFFDCSDTGGTRFKIFSDGDILADGLATASDERLKENIVDCTPKLDDVNKIKIRNFNWRECDSVTGQMRHSKSSASVKRIGVIAQEIEAIFPSLICENVLIEKVEAVDAKDAILDEDGNVQTPAVEAIEAKDELKRKTIKWSVLTPILVKAIQELSAKVTALENA